LLDHRQSDGRARHLLIFKDGDPDDPSEKYSKENDFFDNDDENNTNEPDQVIPDNPEDENNTQEIVGKDLDIGLSILIAIFFAIFLSIIVLIWVIKK